MTTSARRPVPPARGRTARLGLRSPARGDSMESLAARFDLVEQLVEHAQSLTTSAAGAITTGLITGAGALVGFDIAHHATMTGLNPATAALAVAVAAVAVKRVFAGLAALIRPRPAVPDAVGPRPYGEPR